MSDEAGAREYQAAVRHVGEGTRGLIVHAFRERHPELLGMTRREWVLDTFGGYVQLPLDERRDATRELVEVEGLSQREAADVLGVDHATVNRDLRGADAPPAPPDQPEPAAGGADAPPDPTAADRAALAEADRVARDRARERDRAERDDREREEGRERMTYTVRTAIAIVANPASMRWLPDRFPAVVPPVADDERAQALAAFRTLLEGE